MAEQYARRSLATDILAASSMTAATSPGCESSDMWLVGFRHDGLSNFLGVASGELHSLGRPEALGRSTRTLYCGPALSDPITLAGASGSPEGKSDIPFRGAYSPLVI
jgi:hypothetical protein